MATLVSAPNFSSLDNPTITYTNPDGKKVTSLQVCISLRDVQDVVIPYRDIPITDANVVGSYTFNFTNAERESMWNNLSGITGDEVEFRLKTVVNGKTSYSTLIRNYTIENANPIIYATVKDVNPKTLALTNDEYALIKYWSTAKVTMRAVAQQGAAINEDLYIIRNGNDTIYGKEGEFTNVESNQFTFSAEDSRGNVGRRVSTLTMFDYVPLTNNIVDNRPDAVGNMTVACSGNFYNVYFSANVRNALTAQYRYSIAGSESWTPWEDMNVTLNGNSYYATVDFVIDDYNQNQLYTFETRVIDKLDSVYSTTDPVKSMPLFHWGEDDFVFEVPVTFKAGAEGITMGENPVIEGDLNVTGNLRLKGDGNYGNTLLFGDGTYCYISEYEDDKMMIKASRVDFDANGVYVDGYPIPILDKGIWTPSLNSSAISYYSTQYGWYMKMGQTVTVGFCIKATCNSGYSSTSISISGLPFTPMFSAAGGGMCSGVYISGGFDFQCFVAETSGNITTRVQSCNNTSATNISTSASGCNYRNNGGEITLSGTITFMANT